ncbi:MAG: hypothetical protein HKN49_06790 [Gammaproteobacteria bacterium]|nr:hypothetical protein [Gammaproteobacteria bacterium]
MSNVILHFEPGETVRQDVEIENTSEQPLYIDVKPHVVSKPGTVDEVRTFIEDPMEAGLLVTPSKLVVPPHGRKLLRFVDLKPGHPDERIYRVAVTPVVGDIEAQTSGLKILVGYEVLVLAQPQQPLVKLTGERDGKALFLRNEGNTNVLLREGRQCPAADSDPADCHYLATRRLYPGNEMRVELAIDSSVDYYLGIGTRSSVQSWP